MCVPNCTGCETCVIEDRDSETFDRLRDALIHECPELDLPIDCKHVDGEFWVGFHDRFSIEDDSETIIEALRNRIESQINLKDWKKDIGQVFAMGHWLSEKGYCSTTAIKHCDIYFVAMRLEMERIEATSKLLAAH